MGRRVKLVVVLVDAGSAEQLLNVTGECRECDKRILPQTPLTESILGAYRKKARKNPGLCVVWRTTRLRVVTELHGALARVHSRLS